MKGGERFKYGEYLGVGGGKGGRTTQRGREGV